VPCSRRAWPAPFPDPLRDDAQVGCDEHGRAAGAGRRPGLAPAGRPDPDELVLRPRTGWIAIDWGELYRNRELLYFFVWRDLKVRYKQTVLGVAWGILQPLLMMAIFTFVFGRVAQIPSEGFPYPVFVYAGLLPWLFFANGIGQGGQSLVTQNYILSKIYLPRLFIPTAAVGVFVVDLAASFVIYMLILFWYGITPQWTIVFVPAILGLAGLLTLGLTYILSALTALYRDFRFVIPFLVQIWMYVSPVIYPARLLPRKLQPVLALNPMLGIIESMRSAILGTPWNWPALAASVVLSTATFVFGLYYFRKIERRFADII
jgi:lipopolysaccharide transport system permease protein